MQTLRRCAEDRDDFTFEDASCFPMRLMEGGELYGFCPAKVTWDMQNSRLYNILALSAETNNFLTLGGIEDQPAWFIDVASWFIPTYNELKFVRRAKMILGDGSKTGVSKNGNQRAKLKS